MANGHVFRRMLHMTAPLFLIYYWMPDQLIFFKKWVSLSLVTLGGAIVEGVRLKKGIVFFGLREYERHYVSAWFWWLLGMALALLFFPMHLVVVAFLGCGFIDPLIGELERRNEGKVFAFPIVCYFGIGFFYLTIFAGFNIWLAGLLAAVAGMVAVASEYPNIKWVNDDFLILVCPLVAMWALQLLL